MRTWKLVSGILSCVLFAFVSFQSCAAGLSNALSENGERSGTSGLFLAFLMLVGGIVSIAVRKSTGRGGNIAIIIIDTLAALIGYSGAGSFADLKVWSTWCLICAVLALVCVIKPGKQSVET